MPADEYDPIDVIVIASGAGPQDARRLGPAHEKLMHLLAGGSVTVIDTADHFQLPVQQIRLLVSDLTEEGLAWTRQQAPQADGPDVGTLRRVIDGLKGLSA